MASKALNEWLFCFTVIIVVILPFRTISTQEIEGPSNGTQGICKGRTYVVAFHSLKSLRGCVTILGNLKVVLGNNFKNVSFPELKEITGYLLFYYVRGITSLGQIFPGLTRIRGNELFMNYALIVHDISTLQEIGLHSLISIDRGSVIMYVPPTTCFMDTVNWNVIAPNVRHVIGQDPGEPDRIKGLPCTSKCSCSQNYSTNYCWNNRKCQRFLDGPDGENCHEQCLGCRLTKRDSCSVCRHFTYQGRCMSSCPANTYVLEENNYCVSLNQCHELSGWLFNDLCVFKCPIEYKIRNNSGEFSCEPCLHCNETCGDLHITSVSAMQNASGCVYVNGSLTIQVRAVVEAMPELRAYLTRLKVVEDYIHIYGSLVITSLDFLPSLRLIGGRQLMHNKYSLRVNDMTSLQTLFTPNVTRNLRIKAGTAMFYNNPMLCEEEINEIKHLFPIEPTKLTVPEGMNGYSGGCIKFNLGLKVNDIEANRAVVRFQRHGNDSLIYSLLYMRLSAGETSEVAPENCSNNDWYVINVESSNKTEVSIFLFDLKPASNYVTCVETYYSTPYTKPKRTRSSIVKFSTKAGRPEPPFMTEVVASSANSIVIHWVNNIDYRPFITRYEMDVTLVDMIEEDNTYFRNHCEDPVSRDTVIRYDGFTTHAVVIRPPLGYEEPCESMCGILSKGITGAMVQEDFDPCLLDLNCEDIQEADAPQNVTFSEYKYYTSISVNIYGTAKDYQVGGLAPYRNYRVRLRACTDLECSRSSRRVVRTKALRGADLAQIVKAGAYNSIVNIQWEAPKVPNGLVLSYIIQVTQKRKFPEIGVQIPYDLCVTGKELSASLSALPADSYMVRVCTTTLAPDSTCTRWVKVPNRYELEWWWWPGLGIPAATLLCLLSVYLQRLCPCFKLPVHKSYRRQSDESTNTYPITSLSGSFMDITENRDTAIPNNLFSNPFSNRSKAADEVELITFAEFDG